MVANQALLANDILERKCLSVSLSLHRRHGAGLAAARRPMSPLRRPDPETRLIRQQKNPYIYVTRRDMARLSPEMAADELGLQPGHSAPDTSGYSHRPQDIEFIRRWSHPPTTGTLHGAIVSPDQRRGTAENHDREVSGAGLAGCPCLTPSGNRRPTVLHVLPEIGPMLAAPCRACSYRQCDGAVWRRHSDLPTHATHNDHFTAPARPARASPSCWRTFNVARTAQAPNVSLAGYRDTPSCGWTVAPACQQHRRAKLHAQPCWVEPRLYNGHRPEGCRNRPRRLLATRQSLGPFVPATSKKSGADP